MTPSSFDEAAEELHDRAAGAGVELAGRLVGEQEGGLIGEGAGDGDALLLAAGEFVRAVLRAVAEADHVEQRPGALGAGAALGPGEAQRDLDVLGGAEDRDEAEGLEDEAEPVRGAGPPARPRPSP